MDEETVIEPKRVKTFARFFKNYMSVSSLVVAALPIPVTAFKLIPTYTAQTSLLSVYTSLFCFLLLGFIFYSRHALARLMFRDFFAAAAPAPTVRLILFLPALLTLASLGSLFGYHYLLGESIRYSKPELGTDAPSYIEAILTKSELWQIPFGTGLMAFYLGIFVFAESAFIVMAIKEYMQDVAKLSEMHLIRGVKP
jgi:hypothetical protein